jgi:hypothetical protein
MFVRIPVVLMYVPLTAACVTVALIYKASTKCLKRHTSLVHIDSELRKIDKGQRAKLKSRVHALRILYVWLLFLIISILCAATGDGIVLHPLHWRMHDIE